MISGQKRRSRLSRCFKPCRCTKLASVGCSIPWFDLPTQLKCLSEVRCLMCAISSDKLPTCESLLSMRSFSSLGRNCRLASPSAVKALAKAPLSKGGDVAQVGEAAAGKCFRACHFECYEMLQSVKRLQVVVPHVFQIQS